MKTLILMLIFTAAIVGAAVPVLAVNSSFDDAEVISADPIVETYEVEVPREECWTERQPVTTNSRSGSITPEIVGAIVGGAVGYQFGNGRGQDIATVAGAVLGGSVGHDLKVRNSRQAGVYQDVQRCQMVNEYNTAERIVAYDVAYRYQGEIYRTTMDHDPGERVRVAISVDVVE